MTIDRNVRGQDRSLFCLFLLAHLLLLATFALTAPPVRAATASIVTVKSPHDDGIAVPDHCPGAICRLRDAVAKAASGDTINFDAVAFSTPVTITLITSNITIDKDLTIDGSTAPFTPTISGPGTSCVPTTIPPTNCFRVFIISAGNVTLNKLRIVNGRLVGSQGAGIFNSGTLMVTNSAFSNNVTTGNYGTGAALYNSAVGKVTVMNSTFASNSANTGGALATYGPLTLTSSILTNNTAASYGGGLYSRVPFTVSNSVFSVNMAGISGGGLDYNNPDTPIAATVMSSVFISNSASSSGGGILLYHGSMAVTNSTLWGNNGGGSGGAVHNNGTGNLALSNSTISDNSAGNGGGISNDGTATVKNAIVIKGALGTNCFGLALAAGSTNNMNDDTSCGSSFTQPPSLLLGSLGSCGGSTQTIPLLPNSPAIDAGNAAACPATDQRGISRPSSACDIGAFESQGFTFQSLTGTPQSTPPNTAFATPLGLTVVPTGTLEPVDGGQVLFTAPIGSSVPSATPARATLTISGGHVSQAMTANGIIGGPYNVVASARGASNAYFVLTNVIIRNVFLPLVKR